MAVRFIHLDAIALIPGTLLAAFAVTSSVIASSAIASSAIASSAMAQTLTDPNPGTRSAHPSGKSAATKQPTKSCPEFGPGFVRMPGSDACIKVGGFVEGGVSGGNH
jgi:Porin subfamily